MPPSSLSAYFLFCSWCCSDSTRFSCTLFEAQDSLSTSRNSLCIFFLCSSNFRRHLASSSTSIQSLHTSSESPSSSKEIPDPFCAPSFFLTAPNSCSKLLILGFQASSFSLPLLRLPVQRRRDVVITSPATAILSTHQLRTEFCTSTPF